MSSKLTTWVGRGALIVEYDPTILFNQMVHFRDIRLLSCDKKLTFNKTFKDYELT